MISRATVVVGLHVVVITAAAGCNGDDPVPPLPPEPVGCFAAPANQAVVEDRALVTLRGLALPGTERVELEAKDVSNDAYATIGNARLDGPSSEACAGATQGIAWSADIALPTNRRFYAASGAHNAIVIRAAGFDANGNSTGPEITLNVRCGATQGLCCAPWDYANSRALQYGEPCVGSNARDCDRCDAPGALCDWDFTCKTELWPPDSSAYTPNVTFPPPEIQQDWTWNVQGVATDGAYWYLTQGNVSVLGPPYTTKGTLYKVPVGAELDQNFYPSSASAVFPHLQDMPGPYCWHWGDPEVSSGRVYIPLEDCDDRQNRILEVDASSLTPLGTAPLEGLSAPTIAVHPSTGEFFVTGPYDVNASTTTLRVYQARPSSSDTPFTLTPDRDIGVFDTDGVTPLTLHIVQGLAFSPSGKLYAAAQGTDQNVYCLQVSPDKATLMHRVFVEMHEERGEDQEYEGIAALDMGPDFGQIHLFTYQNAGIAHEHGAWFKHIKLSDLGSNPSWY
jgi:hypothetical protein